MYESFFSLSQLPFGLTPNTEFFLELPSHRDALQMLKVTIDNAEGFIKIVGEVGTGKTLLCRKLLNELENDSRYYSAYIPNPYLAPHELQLAVADELTISSRSDASVHALNKMLTERLIDLAAQNRRVVLVVDEAQAMPPETLEALRLMTNLETESRKLLQVVLFGQPELNRTLAQQEFRQLRQRITFSQPLRALTEQETTAYVAHRLAIAGYKGIHLFDGGALQLMHHASGGIPRLINILAHKSLMLTYGKGQHQVTKSEIRAAILDTEGIDGAALVAFGAFAEEVRMSVVNTMLRDLDARSGELRQPKIPVRSEAPASHPWLLIAMAMIATVAIGWILFAPKSEVFARADTANTSIVADPEVVAMAAVAPVVSTPSAEVLTRAEPVADVMPAAAVQNVESAQAAAALHASWQWSNDSFALQLDDVHDVRYGIERVDAKTLKISLTHPSLALLDIPAPTPQWIESLKLQRDVQQQTVTVSAQARLEYEVAKLEDGALVISVWRDVRSTVANIEHKTIAATKEMPSAASSVVAAPPREYTRPRIDRSTLTPAQRDSRQAAEAASQLRAGQQSESIKTLRAVLQSGEAAPKSAALLVTILMSQQRLSDAQPYLDRALQQAPKESALLKLKARMLAAQGDVAGARQLLAPLVAEAGTDIELLGLAASLAQQSQDFEAAATHYLQWTRVEPEGGAAWYGLALAFDAQASNANAIAAYQRALALIRDIRLRDYASTRLAALQRSAAVAR